MIGIVGLGPAPARDLLKPYDPAGMEMWPVSPLVNNVRNDETGLFDPIAA